MKIDWLRKLSSRKFWAAAASIVTAILLACKVDELTVEQISLIISSIGVAAVYILGESYVDGKHAEKHCDDMESND